MNKTVRIICTKDQKVWHNASAMFLGVQPAYTKDEAQKALACLTHDSPLYTFKAVPYV